MNLLHVTGSYPLGTHTFVMWQLRGALDIGHQVAVLATHPGNPAGEEMAKQLGLPRDAALVANFRDHSPWRLDPRRLKPAIRAAANRPLFGRRLAERRKSFFCALLDDPRIRNADLIQVHFVSWAVEVGLPLARILNRPCVVTAHGAVADTPVEALRQVQQQADAIVLVSDQELQAWIDRTGSAAKLHRVWNGLPLATVPPRTPRPTSEPLRLVTISRLAPEKRVGDIIEVVAELNHRQCACELTVFGEGPLGETLRQRVHQLGLDDQINLAGSAPHRDVMDTLVQSDILLHGAELEPFGLAMIEAMSAGLPVIAARSGGASQIVAHDTTGFVVAPGDVLSMADFVQRLTEDRGLGRSMGEAGRKRAEALFSLDAHIADMDRLWRSALGAHPSANAKIHCRS